MDLYYVVDIDDIFLLSLIIVVTLFTGIFIISEEDIFEDPNIFSKIKSILNHTYKVLSSTQHMYGNYPYDNNRLVLHMATNTKVITCKSVEVGSGTKTVIKPAEWKFLPKVPQWQRLDCYYEFDDIYPVVVKNSGISVKQQFQVYYSYRILYFSLLHDGQLILNQNSLDPSG